MSLREDVTEFHKRYGHVVGVKPHVPDRATMQMRMALVAEEFAEFMEACGVSMLRMHHLRVSLSEAIHDEHSLKVDMFDLVDAMADLDYVVEGTRIVMGVDGEPIACAVHAANMTKEPRLDASGQPDPLQKPLKPDGWHGPDIEGLLYEQGFVDS